MIWLSIIKNWRGQDGGQTSQRIPHDREVDIVSEMTEHLKEKEKEVDILKRRCIVL